MDKITMLGASQSGKTCFIYAMYDFMQRSRNGFSFIAKNYDDDADLSEGWESIAYDGVWPPGTAETRDYDFNVLFHSKKILDFSWCDYRGGVLRERSTNEDVQKLMSRIKDSSCLIICVGADKVKDIIANESSRNAMELKRLNSFIARYSAENNKRIPIIFALTKADMYTPDEQKKLMSVVKTFFDPLFVQGSCWLVAVLPVCLGKFDNTEGSDRVNGIVAPKNIHIPVMFFLNAVLKDRVREIECKLKNIDTKRVEEENYRRTNADQNFFSKLWNGDRTLQSNRRTDKLNEEQKNLNDLLNDINEVFANMRDMFKVCKVYFDGNEVQF